MSKFTSQNQNEIASTFLETTDLESRQKDVVLDASKKLGFIPEKLIGRSRWWKSNKIGAFHYKGTYRGKSAVLKI